MQYTIRNIPRLLDKALRAKARADGRSLNEAAIAALATGLRLQGQPAKYRDLSRFAATWTEDPAFDEAIADFARINPELWSLSHEAGRGHEPLHRPSARPAGRRRSA